MKIFELVKKLLDCKDSLSSKSLSLFVSTITGGLIALTVCVVLLIDVCSNGYIKTDLSDLGFFMLCIGGYIAGSGMTKAMSEREEYRSKRPRPRRDKI